MINILNKLNKPLLFFVLFFIFFWSDNLKALNLPKTLNQYVHTVWQVKDGLPQNTIRAITQTKDGYIWLGTQVGLVRFDGVKFTVFDKKNTPKLTSNNIVALLTDKDNNLWIGTYSGGITRFKNGKFVSYTTKQGLSSERIKVIYQDKSGRIWVGSNSGGLDLFDNEKFVSRSAKRFSEDIIWTIYEDKTNNLWIGTNNGLFNYNNGNFSLYTTEQGLSSNKVRTIYEDKKSNLWIGTADGTLNLFKDDVFTSYSIKGGISNHSVFTIHEDKNDKLWIGTYGSGLNLFENGKRIQYSDKSVLSNELVWSFFEDHENNMWVGTALGGLNFYHEGKFTSYTIKDGLSAEIVTAIYQDDKGDFWIGTYGGGLNLFKDGKFTSFTTKDGLSSNIVWSIFQDKYNNIWVGTYRGGLNKYYNNKFTVYTTKNGLASDVVTSINEDNKGNLWIGTNRGLNILKDEKFSTYTIKDGLASNEVNIIYKDNNKDMWVGVNGGLNRFKDEKFTTYSVQDGLSAGNVTAIYQDTDNDFWLGTGNGGINLFRNEKFTNYTTNEGLLDDLVFNIVEDNLGNMWMSCNKGVFSVKKRELLDLADGKIHSVHSSVYNISDGMKSRECVGGAQPSVWKTSEGKIYFSTIKGLTMVWPEKLSVNKVTPPVHIEKVFVDGKIINTAKSVQIPAEANKLEFHYTGLSFVTPEKVKFKYILEGFDKEWVDVKTRRIAYYTNLSPRDYIFRVKACNNDGVWNDTGAYFKFKKLPYFYQTNLFYGLCFLITCFLIFSVYFLKIRQIKAKQQQLESFNIKLKNKVTNKTADLKNQTEQALEAKNQAVEARAESERARLESELAREEAEHARLESEYARKEAEQAHEQAEVAKNFAIQSQNETEVLNEKLKEMDKQKTLFFQNITHEFRTPLTLVIGPLEMLLQNKYNHDFIKEQISISIRNSRRLLRLINQLLDLSKLEAGQMKLKVKPTNIVKKLKIITSSFHSKAQSKNVDLIFKGFSQDLFCYLDQEKFEKIIYNLLSNSIKFTEKGKIIISLKKDEHNAIISVKDTGCGIPEKDIPFIFDRFRQADGSTTREQEGTGIGLSLVKEYIKLHHGEIKVFSMIGEGTEFVARLPLGTKHLIDDEIIITDKECYEGDEFIEEKAIIQLNDTDNEFNNSTDEINSYVNESANMSNLIEETELSILENTKPVTSYNQADMYKDINEYNVMIVEDNHDMRSYIKSVLCPFYNIVEATNGLDGLEKLKENTINLIISDVMMPKMDGTQMLAIIKKDEKTKSIPFILLTAKVSEEYKLEGLESGADDYLAKPFNPRELLVRVKNILTIKKQADEIANHLRELVKQKDEELVQQSKLAQVGEMLRDLAHELKNLQGASLNAVEIVIENLNSLLKMFEIHEKWKDIIDAIFSVKSVSVKEQMQRMKNHSVILNGMEDELRYLADELLDHLCGLDVSDQLLQELCSNMKELGETELVLLNKIIESSIGSALVQRTTRHANELMLATLDHTRSSEKGPYNLKDIISSCVLLLKKNIDRALIDIDVDGIPDLFLNTKLPKNNLNQIILNLIKNAYESLSLHTTNPAKMIKVYLSKHDKDKHILVINVEDNGPGIPKDIIPKIGVKNFSTKGNAGNGIGIYTSRKLAKEHEGFLEIESQPNKTCFQLGVKMEP